MIPLYLFVTFVQISPRAAQLQIQAQYDSLDRAFRKKDPSILAKVMASDFTTDSPAGGAIDRKAAFAQFNGLIHAAKDAKWPRRVAKVELKGHDYLATVSGHFEGTLPGQDGKPHRTELISLVEDTWGHSARGWQIHHSHILHVKMIQDGIVVGGR